MNATIAKPAATAPATPLPWEIVETAYTEIRGNSRNTNVADMRENNANRDGRNAAYIVHAANNLPRLEAERAQLVAALRACINGMPHNRPQDDARALLCDLGEL